MPVPNRFNPNQFRDFLPGTSPYTSPGSSYRPAVPDYLIRNQNGTYTFSEGTTNRQVVDTLRDMGVLEEKDYDWFLKWFGESADQGQDVANQGWMVTNAGGLTSEGQDWAPESRRRVNLVYDWLNRYGEEGSFNPTTTFAETYGVSTQPIAQPGSGSQQGDLGPGYTPSGRPIFAGDAPTGGDPSAPYYTVEDVRADSEVVLGRKEPEEPPPPQTKEDIPPPKDLTSDTPSPEDVPPPPDDTSLVKTQGIASTLGVDIPDFADFGSFMAKKRSGLGDREIFEDEVEKEIERRATEIAAASGTSSSSSSGSTSPYMGSSIFGSGFMGITPEMIQAAIAAARDRGIDIPETVAPTTNTETEKPVEMAEGGIVSLMKDEGMSPTGEGIESFLMKYQSPGTVSRERKAAALRRTMQRLQQEQMQQQQMQQQQMMQQQMPPQGPPGMPPGGMPPGPPPTAPGPMPTMQQGIMPMAG